VVANLDPLTVMASLVRKAWRVSRGAQRWLATELSASIGRGARCSPADAPTMLLLAWYFPPLVSGGTYRPLSLVRHGATVGWRFVVVGGDTGMPAAAAGQRLLEGVPQDARVARVPVAGRFVFDIDGGFLTALDVVAAARRLLGTVRPTVVLASGPPFSLHVAGRYLARHYRVPLVLDYRDEWTNCPFEFVRTGRTDRWWERRTLAAADLVIFTTELQRTKQLATFTDLDRAKCAVVPNGWDRLDPSPEALPAVPQVRAPLLAFVGNLGEHTPPDAFLATLAGVIDRSPCLKTKLRVSFVGQKSFSTRTRLEAFRHREVVSAIDQVPHDEAIRIMRSARMLLILNDQRLTRYLPGKIYEYLAARRPILVFGQGGEVETLVRHLKAGTVVPAGDRDALRAVLDDMVRHEPEDLTSTDLLAWLVRHARSELAYDLLTRIHRVAGTSDRAMASPRS
jgi:glycosyltransferase involved in cell wall biosynthesis